jgi:hypothetical protein
VATARELLTGERGDENQNTEAHGRGDAPQIIALTRTEGKVTRHKAKGRRHKAEGKRARTPRLDGHAPDLTAIADLRRVGATSALNRQPEMSGS